MSSRLLNIKNSEELDKIIDKMDVDACIMVRNEMSAMYLDMEMNNRVNHSYESRNDFLETAQQIYQIICKLRNKIAKSMSTNKTVISHVK